MRVSTLPCAHSRGGARQSTENAQVVVPPPDAHERLREVLPLLRLEVRQARDVALEGDDEDLERPRGPVRHERDKVRAEVDHARGLGRGRVQGELARGVSEEEGGEAVGAAQA